MNLHEYQAKDLLARYGVPVPRGLTVTSADQMTGALDGLGGSRWVVKAQIQAGGRGRAGGVVLAEGREPALAAAGRLLGQRLVTRQSGPDGLPVERLLIEETCEIARELYLAVLVDRATGRVAFMASAAGGMDIEEVAASRPEAILFSQVAPAIGLLPWQGRRLGFGLGLSAAQIRALQGVMSGLYRLFTECDANLVEINPLILTPADELIALDAKVVLDDNALYRHPELAAWRDPAQEDPREAAARAHDLSYISLDGNIGCLVNGAGLAMATMDLVKLHGGAPANFLDVGGGTTAERVAEAFKLILSDAKVAGILVNIFGGIVRCDLIAEGLIQAVREVAIQVPLVVRLEGTRASEGLALLADSGLPLKTAEGLDEAARQIVAAVASKTAGEGR
ncbi:ADP-forming succinate--CoA ligase subunit beta [Thioalkalicoccus limnaeus]|uniref:Succinate--CoA ligase [ADP-forming] subunit beta n=1 Tax=Thioalkalicoccus limnaeus TaxID=120681 RepID=A0ABV4BHA0_9GAMM